MVFSTAAADEVVISHQPSRPRREPSTEVQAPNEPEMGKRGLAGRRGRADDTLRTICSSVDCCLAAVFACRGRATRRPWRSCASRSRSDIASSFGVGEDQTASWLADDSASSLVQRGKGDHGRSGARMAEISSCGHLNMSRSTPSSHRAGTPASSLTPRCRCFSSSTSLDPRR